jgi:nicotinate-nucleotide pyrophosphorylase (carboxylating)
MTGARFAPMLPPPLVEQAVTAALAEDLGLAGDLTTNATIDAGATAEAVIAARMPGVIAGIEVARAAFQVLDSEAGFEIINGDGAHIKAGMTVARIQGNARALLSSERVALNFLGRMSGIATLTNRYVEAIKDTKAHITDTRKTTPMLRAFEKYAVRCGGGMNHRAGLFDAILIKDNHIVAAGGLAQAIEKARAQAGHMIKIEVEVDSLTQLEVALKHKIDAVLLDNMTTDQLRRAVKLVNGRILTEASGGVTLDTVRVIAETGVNLISVGALTHSAPVLDLGLDFELSHSAKPGRR